MCKFGRFKNTEMQITSVHNNWKDDALNIDLSLGNICNYKCWYCWPGSNEGNYKWPDLDLLKTNITHLINYYLENSNKKEIDIHFVEANLHIGQSYLSSFLFLKKTLIA